MTFYPKVCGNGFCDCRQSRCCECRKMFSHGARSHCSNRDCVEMLVPLECARCKLVVSNNLDGVLDYEMNLIPYKDSTLPKGYKQ